MLNIFLAGTILLLGSCKKEENTDNGNNSEEKLFKSYQVMEDANGEFIRIGDSLNINPKEAFVLLADYVKNLQDVAEVQLLDSIYLWITTTSGYSLSISIREIDQDGMCIHRGSPAGTSALKDFAGTCRNKIENKKVLLYAAYHDDFYGTNEYQTRVVDVIENGDVNVDVTVLKNQDCTPDIVKIFNQYGLVILDTHGEPGAVYTGIKFYLIPAAIPGSVDAFHDMLATKIGSQNIPDVINKNLSFGYSYKYNPSLQNQQVWNDYKGGLNTEYCLTLTSKGIRELVPDLSNTVVFANCCYSGFNATTYSPRANRTIHYDPVQPAWMSRNPISYYAYEATNKGVSYKAGNAFCKQNEDTLIYSLFYDGDSTGQAHLFNGTTVHTEPYNRLHHSWYNNEGPFSFKQYGKMGWCYGSCKKTFIDSRDGQEYASTCIGEQIWMGQNLNYAGPNGDIGACYKNKPSNCAIYGRLYTIGEVTGLQTSSANPSGIKGICPDGWHVPSKAEWEELFASIGGEDVIGVKLLAQTLWNTASNPSSDEFDFTLLPAGEFFGDGVTDLFTELLITTYLWTTDGDGNNQYLALNIAINGDVHWGWVEPPPDKNWKYSCRCVKD